MNKHEVFAHFSSILDNMLDTSLFFCTFFQQPYSTENIFGDAGDEAMPENLSIRFGATRGCIVDSDYDYVVKFDVEDDINGSACEREKYLYKAAAAEGLEKYFAECNYIGTYTKSIQFYDSSLIEKNMSWFDYDPESFDEEFMSHEDDFGEIHSIVISIPLYAYPKAEKIPCYVLSEEEETSCKLIARNSDSPLRERNLAVAINFIHCYGQEEYERISEFMYNEDINDLHFSNVGEIDGRYVIIDYSGYHGDFSIDE